MNPIVYSRVASQGVNTLLACIVNADVRLKSSQWDRVRGTCFVVNYYDYLNSQLYNNLHQYIFNPFEKSLCRVSIPTRDFGNAKAYVESVVHNTVLANDTQLLASNRTCVKAFLSEMIAVQLVISQAEMISDGTETPILCTFPTRFLANSKVFEADRDIESILGMQDCYVRFNDFDFIFYHILENDMVEDALAILTKFSSTITYHLDFNQLLISTLDNPTPLIRQSIAQLWLLSKDIYGFGGIYAST